MAQKHRTHLFIGAPIGVICKRVSIFLSHISHFYPHKWDWICQPLKEETEQKTKATDDTAFWLMPHQGFRVRVQAAPISFHFVISHKMKTSKNSDKIIKLFFVGLQCVRKVELLYPVHSIVLNKNAHCQQNFGQDHNRAAERKMNAGVSVFSSSFDSSSSFHACINVMVILRN